MKVTYLGTTMLLFDDGVDQILFDCHVTRPSLKTCLRGLLSTDEAIADRVIADYKMDRLKAIFVSHSHHDHVLDAPYFATKCGCELYGSSSAVNVALGNGVKKEQAHAYAEEVEKASLQAYDKGKDTRSTEVGGNHYVSQEPRVGAKEQVEYPTYQLGNFHIQVLPSIHSVPHWYNDDIGQTIEEPFAYPAPKSSFKEGGSVDFLVKHDEQTFLIRPSYNYLPGQLDGIRADYLFLGIGGMSRDSKERHETFFAETIDKVQPKLVIPIHWDNFFTPLYGDVKHMPLKIENTGKAMRIVTDHCAKNGVDCLVQLPRTSIVISEKNLKSEQRCIDGKA